MARLRLIPQNRQFFVLFNEAAANLIAISEVLHEMLAGFPETRDLAAQVHDLEHRGDEITHEIVRLLSSTFVTPLDREDLYALAGTLDDVCDYIDEAADEIILYGVRAVPPEALGQADVIRRACRCIAASIERLDGLRDATDQLVEIHTLENEGDRLEHDAVAKLFSGGHDALVVIRWKDIHERLEEAIDSCEHAAHVLETAYLKHH